MDYHRYKLTDTEQKDSQTLNLNKNSQTLNLNKKTPKLIDQEHTVMQAL